MVDVTSHDSTHKKTALSINIKDRHVLYAAYMSFLRAGGLFIPTKKNFNMGDELALTIKLVDEPDKYHVSGKIVWITPPGAQGNKAGGIGMEFEGEEGEAIRTKIEALLGPMLQSSDATHTM